MEERLQILEMKVEKLLFLLKKLAEALDHIYDV
jgi:hypothetical protein